MEQRKAREEPATSETTIAASGYCPPSTVDSARETAGYNGMNAHAFCVTFPAASSGRSVGYPELATTQYHCPSHRIESEPIVAASPVRRDEMSAPMTRNTVVMTRATR